MEPLLDRYGNEFLENTFYRSFLGNTYQLVWTQQLGLCLWDVYAMTIEKATYENCRGLRKV